MLQIAGALYAPAAGSPDRKGAAIVISVADEHGRGSS